MNAANLKKSAPSSAPNGPRASSAVSRNWKPNSLRCKNVSTKMWARVVEAVKERELRSSLEKTTRRKIQDVRSEAREELNAAVVQTISESQSDLGLTTGKTVAVAAARLLPGARLQVHGFSKPVVLRRIEGSSAEIEAGPLRMKIGIDEIVGYRGRRSRAGTGHCAARSIASPTQRQRQLRIQRRPRRRRT